MSCNQTDDDIITLILNGKPERFADLVNKYKQKVYGILVGMGATHDDAQDTAQEAFMKAYRNLGSLESGKSFGRLVLLLRYTEELTYEEMCAVTGLNMHQVKNALYRGKQSLKRHIEQKGAYAYGTELHQSRTY